MALIAALLPDHVDRASLVTAVPQCGVAWAGSWRELYQLVRVRPIEAAVANPLGFTEKEFDSGLSEHHQLVPRNSA